MSHFFILFKPNPHGTYQERKAWRTQEFLKNFGKKLETCTACSGSGYYDSTGSPPCGACEGTGKVREK